MLRQHSRLILLAALGLLIAAAAAAGCNRVGSAMTGNGRITHQQIKLADFTRVDVRGAFTVEIVQGDRYEIILSTDENLINRIVVKRQDETLSFSVQAPANFFPTSLKASVKMPRIYSLKLNAGAIATMTGFQSTFNFDLEIGSSSAIGGYLDAGITAIRAGGGSRLNLVGKAIELSLEGSGGSQTDLSEFTVGDATVKLSGASTATINAGDNLGATLTESSRLYYVGNPKIAAANVSSDSVLQHK